jgi:hypothetical protein
MAFRIGDVAPPGLDCDIIDHVELPTPNQPMSSDAGSPALIENSPREDADADPRVD